MRTGLPYQGGKSKLAEWIIDLFPKATYFYDLFAGGCSISHVALLSGKLTTSVGDYRDVEILPDSVTYVDPP